MTPTPEMIAMAERIAGEAHPSITLRRQRATKYAVLRAIMEVSEKHGDALREARKGIPETVNRKMRTLELSIRNGEHLR